MNLLFSWMKLFHSYIISYRAAVAIITPNVYFGPNRLAYIDRIIKLKTSW